jgi:hypothetical protein
MHAQNAALFLGQIPNPKSGEPEVNLDLARMFIDQLAMIQEKTRGNLTNEEATVLGNTLSNLQMAYVEASGETRTESTRHDEHGGVSATQPESPAAAVPHESSEESSPGTTVPSQPAGSTDSESESRKKFTKSYGP